MNEFKVGQHIYFINIISNTPISIDLNILSGELIFIKNNNLYIEEILNKKVSIIDKKICFHSQEDAQKHVIENIHEHY